MMPRPPFPFPGFVPTTPVLPKLYWDAITPEQELHELCKRLHALFDYASKLGTLTAEQQREIAELQRLFTEFQESGFEEYYEQQLQAWIEAHAGELFESLAKMVFFGLTSDGHFCAYIPESWSDIQFDTGMVYGRYDYGRLILRYDVDGSGVIDNTGSYDQSATASILHRIGHLEQTVYTILAQGGN